MADSGKDLVLNLTFDPGRRIASTERFKRQSEQPEDITRSGYDVGWSCFPQDRGTKAKNSYNVLYTVIKELVRGY